MKDSASYVKKCELQVQSPAGRQGGTEKFPAGNSATIFGLLDGPFGYVWVMEGSEKGGAGRRGQRPLDII